METLRDYQSEMGMEKGERTWKSHKADADHMNQLRGTNKIKPNYFLCRGTKGKTPQEEAARQQVGSIDRRSAETGLTGGSSSAAHQHHSRGEPPTSVSGAILPEHLGGWTRQQHADHINNDGRLQRLSRTMAFLLRHGKDKETGEILVYADSDGWVQVHDVIEYRHLTRDGFTLEDLEYVCEYNDKGRYQVRKESHGAYVRAFAGHSRENVFRPSDHKLIKLGDPDCPHVITHGSKEKYLVSILTHGLRNNEQRNDIHFVGLAPTNTKFVPRGKDNMHVWVDIRQAIKDGVKFYRTPNDIIVSPGEAGIISPRYIIKTTRARRHAGEQGYHIPWPAGFGHLDQREISVTLPGPTVVRAPPIDTMPDRIRRTGMQSVGAKKPRGSVARSLSNQSGRDGDLRKAPRYNSPDRTPGTSSGSRPAGSMNTRSRAGDDKYSGFARRHGSSNRGNGPQRRHRSPQRARPKSSPRGY